MKMSTKTLAAAVAAVLGGMTLTPANAQNPDYAAGDLVLFFQNPGGTTGADQTLFISLGNTALDFRGTGAGIEAGQSSFTLLNIESALINAFGANWASETTLYAGAAGVWGTAGNISNTLQNGDPNRTVYTSQARNAAGLGTLGVAGSNAWTVSTDGGMTNAASGITGALAAFESLGTSAIAQISINDTTLDNLAPAGGTNFSAFTTPGVMQQGTSTSLGSFGGVDNVEFALDINRILAKTNAPGQTPGTLRVGSYEGTIVLGEDGNISFIGATEIAAAEVPEPVSTAVLFGGVLGMLGMVRRRRA